MPGFSSDAPSNLTAARMHPSAATLTRPEKRNSRVRATPGCSKCLPNSFFTVLNQRSHCLKTAQYSCSNTLLDMPFWPT
eukprot:9396259-Pyramimonas_sp.AAC.1